MGVDIFRFYSLDKAESAGYEPIGKPATISKLAQDFSLEKHKKEVLSFAEQAFQGLKYDCLLVLKISRGETCPDEGLWVQPAKGLSNEEVYQLMRGFAVAPHEKQGELY